MNIRKKEIEEKGYTVLSNLITEKECNHYKTLLENYYETFSPKYAGNS